jgi:hypothetical protein
MKIAVLGKNLNFLGYDERPLHEHNTFEEQQKRLSDFGGLPH